MLQGQVTYYKSKLHTTNYMLQGQIACYKGKLHATMASCMLQVTYATRASYMLQVTCYKGKLHDTRASYMLQGQVTCYKLHATRASYMLQGQVTCYKAFVVVAVLFCCLTFSWHPTVIASLFFFRYLVEGICSDYAGILKHLPEGRGWGVSGENADWNFSPLPCQDQRERYFHTKHNRPKKKKKKKKKDSKVIKSKFGCGFWLWKKKRT